MYAKRAFVEVKVDFGDGRGNKFDPEYPLFSAFFIGALQIASQLGCTRLDLLVERSGATTKRLEAFAGGMADSLAGTPEAHLAPLVGNFLSAGKEDPRLQAADLLCWFPQRAAADNLNRDHQRAYSKIATLHGARFEWTVADLDRMRDRARAQGRRC